MLGNSSSNRDANSTDCRLAFAGVVCQLLFMVLLIIAITLGNLVSLLVFFCVRPFRTAQSYLKASLALADLAVGLIVVPYSVYQETNTLAYGGAEQEESPAGWSVCWITGPIFAGCTFVSISTIFLLSLERTITVLKPLHRKAVITKRRITWLILGSWILSFSLAVIPLLSVPNITFEYNPCSKMCNYGFPLNKLPESNWNVMLLYPIFDFALLGGTFVVNAITFATLRQYRKMRKQLREEPQGTHRLSHSDVTAARTIGILTFAFSVSFVPIAVFVVGAVVGYEWCQFSFYAFWILASNSCWNVAIYSVWDPKFRQGMREMFCKQKLRADSQQYSSHSPERHCSAPACVIVLKDMLRPESN
ncbi:beta-3 adrenergic receptor-like [Notechis scutatus]|uniref:Beta-3 adrenergic receptor-like n=1 Tax=Notechis scutatus TaxID=8663 RepID=A0A6J1V2I5_9SAUR|nr:beta-3 adrenergic receptor-like [Notechis scutatus]